MARERTLEERAAKAASKTKQRAAEKQDGPTRGDAGNVTQTLTQLQQTAGNTAVQRYLAQRSGSGPTEVDEETATTIRAARDGGHGLQTDVAARAGQAMGQDFGDVRIHTDDRADQLSRQLGATAFTTGNNIFFRDGTYDPAGQSGQRLIAHELTHVVQQGAAAASAVQGKMQVNDPNDRYEAEADRVADAVMAAGATTAQREAAPVEEEEPAMAQMQATPEVEEEEPAESLQMQEEEELEEEGG